MSTPNIKTQNICPPIPIRAFDWIAWIDGLEESGPYGAGETEEAAKTDLQFQIERLIP